MSLTIDIIPTPTREQMKILEARSEILKRNLKARGKEIGFIQKQMIIFARDFQKFNNYDLLPQLSWKQELAGMFEFTKAKLISRFRK